MKFTHAADGTRLAYRATGRGEPLLMISGQGLDHHMWDNFAPCLEDNFTLITYDHRGTGESDKPKSPPYSTEMFSEDAATVLAAAGADSAHVFGFSMGGRVSQWLAVSHPKKIRCLILGATTPGNSHGIERNRETSLLLMSGDLIKMEELLYSPKYIAGGGFRLGPPATPDFARKLHFYASENHDAWDQLPNIHCPTLILHGSDDLINPTANADLLAEAIPNAVVQIIEGGRHGFIDEYKEEISQAVKAFIDAQFTGH